MGQSIEVTEAVTVPEDLLAEGLVREWYGIVRSEVPEAVMGEAVHTPLPRHSWWHPLVMSQGP
jgi:hypothetical protein